MPTCLIVDDEPLARQLIESYVAELPELKCLGSYGTALEVLSVLQNESVDVLFLDIEMPGISGLNFIRSLKKPPKVIFITAYAEYAVAAFEVEATDYLVKPVSFERFLIAVQKVLSSRTENTTQSSAKEEKPYLFIKVDRRLVKVDHSSIQYIEGFGDYCRVHTKEQTYTTYITMLKLELLLPSSTFIRIHRSTIINKQYIQFIEGNFIKVGEIDLAIGATYKESVLQLLT